MGWPGIVVLGAAIGIAGWWLHPLRRLNRSSRARLWVAVLAGIVGASVARMAGNVIGLFHDGETLEWPVCTAIAMIAVAVTVGSLSRR
ncbi:MULTISPECIES: hypothetical protein [Paraburkholderia]|jgi:hypothetical protein|uniref:Transglycosylase n=1 Tax=Paraburkholderia strydomiana TaxID=1245417 RepID=A0ABW9C919_9BURK|nr:MULTISPECIES: hypothetical protein [Paraburkholderia]OWJ57013.1 hypothetical protein BWU74_28600 [Burkholderia sp. Bk]MDR7009120.1 putative membrane protein YeaQ/YmgE (transglycosylase-associated protein family) [Paraburkholderia strydomiana]TCG00109.1 hypothetical protein BZM26_15545 [Paraburkholderia strydomiana]CAH2901694.1 MAG: FIG00452780: hypothetical protein [uncultured Paraburkholderia sp.]CAH2935001.1 MAG: FIG00452780: hypothetical protein [uncultured Paraburkholderia sp.]